MTNVREEVHEEIERMCKEELLGFEEFLTKYPTPSAAARRAAALDGEVVAEEERVPPRETNDRG